jgi:replicative DNA helicase
VLDEHAVVRQVLDDAIAGEPEHGEAELALIGSVINAANTKSALWMLKRVEADDLAYGVSRSLRAAIAECVHRNETPDLYTVGDELARRGMLPEDARRLVVRIGSGLPEFEWESAVATIRAHAERRALLREVRAAATAILGGEESLGDVKARLARWLLKEAAREDDVLRLSDAILIELGRIREQDAVPVMMSGIASLDQKAGGLERGQLGIIAGRPGSGKTALALQLLHWAANRWGPVLFLSLEMGTDQLARRTIASVTQWSYQQLRDCGVWEDGQLQYFSDGDKDYLALRCQEQTSTKHDIFVDTSAFKMSQVIERLHSYRLEHGIKAAVIDYGQLLTEDRRKTSGKVEEMSLIARALKKEIADPLEMPVWCLVQPNRASESREGKRLQMHDLGWSSDWEAAATQIWLLNVDRAYAGETHEVGMILDIAKSRNGATGEVPLVFDKPRFRFAGREFYPADEAPEERERCP